jgi:hypothetical protein
MAGARPADGSGVGERLKRELGLGELGRWGDRMVQYMQDRVGQISIRQAA